MPLWDAVDGLVRELGALRAASFALERERVGAEAIAQAEQTIGAAADAIGATIDDPDDTARLIAACEAIVAAQARIDGLRPTRQAAGDPSHADLGDGAQRLYAHVRGRRSS